MQEQSVKHTQNEISHNHTEHTGALLCFPAEKLHWD